MISRLFWAISLTSPSRVHVRVPGYENRSVLCHITRMSCCNRQMIWKNESCIHHIIWISLCLRGLIRTLQFERTCFRRTPAALLDFSTSVMSPWRAGQSTGSARKRELKSLAEALSQIIPPLDVDLCFELLRLLILLASVIGMWTEGEVKSMRETSSDGVREAVVCASWSSRLWVKSFIEIWEAVNIITDSADINVEWQAERSK